MTQPDSDTRFLFSPSSTYPNPVACLLNRAGEIVHAWSHPDGQPNPATDPPGYLRGWNHVEPGPGGSLYAIVPLHSLLKLNADSTLAWHSPVTAHHDLHVSADGTIHVLTEEPRLLQVRGHDFVLLDNPVTVLNPDGTVIAAYSLYDVLSTDPRLRDRIAVAIEARALAPETVTAADLYRTSDRAPGRGISRALRDLPGSPSDVLHANTVDVLTAHPAGLWEAGDLLVAVRNLDLIAVISPAAGVVRWWWGPGELSGPHQPSMLPGGTVLIFDNGRYPRRSRLVEVNPVTGAIVWQYTANPPASLFCPLAGGCEQLPSGNLLISDARSGRALEITRGGDTVWELHARTAPEPAEPVAFYRMAATAPSSTTGAPPSDMAMRLAQSQLRCHITTGQDCP